MEAHLQRLEALRAQNAQRRQRLEEERAERQAIEQNRVRPACTAWISCVSCRCVCSLRPPVDWQVLRRFALIWVCSNLLARCPIVVRSLQVPKETLEQERSMLEARISALSVRSSSSAMTPGREGELVKQVAAKREEVEALLGLHVSGYRIQ